MPQIRPITDLRNTNEISDIFLSDADGMELLRHQATLKGELMNLTRKEFELPIIYTISMT